MPTIEVSQRDLCSLIGKTLTLESLKEHVLYAKGEVEEARGDTLKLDVKDTNRPDLWSAEGVAREIAGRLGKPGLPEYKVKPSGITVKADKTVPRPMIVSAVVKGLDITKEALSQMIQLQEKVSLTFGRNRKEVAIGVYDLQKIKPPIKYTSVRPDGIKFVPLELRKELTPRQILEQHPKGREFAHLLSGLRKYPLLIDSANEVLSMPPIINSEHTGKVTEKTRDVFIECTGFELKSLLPALNVIVAALADRGGRLESVKTIYQGKTIVTPDLAPKKTSVNTDFVRQVSGLKLSDREICSLLEKARYKARPGGRNIQLLYPAYRQDIMHPVDVVEDVIISYGYGRIEPVVPRIATRGSAREIETFSEVLSEIMAGLGFQEVMSYILTNRENLFGKMNVKETNVVEIENIVSANWCVFRNWVLPNMMEFLSMNRHREFPQKVFEIGEAVIPNSAAETGATDARKLSAVISDTSAGYEDIASVLDALMRTLGISYSLRKANHPSFISGRTASITHTGREIGVIGEIHPGVLSAWGIENPTAGFELNIGRLYNLLRK